MVAEFNVSLAIGDTRKFIFPVQAPDKSNDFADLTDVVNIKYEITGAIDGDATVFELTLSDSNLEITTASNIDSVDVSDLDPSTDVISVFLEPVDTALLPTSNVEHELQIEDIEGNITTVMQGNVETIPTAIEPRQA